MTFSSQLKGMLKSHFIIMKRNKCLSLIEIFCPSILLLFCLLLSLFFEKEEKAYNQLFNNTTEFVAYYSSNLTNKVNSSSQIISNLSDMNKSTPIQYKKFLSQCEKNPFIALIGNNFPTKLKNEISKHSWELKDENKYQNINYEYFSSIDDFNSKISNENYGKQNQEICFGVSKNDNIDYGFGIHYDTIDLNDEKMFSEKNVPTIPDSKNSKYEKIKTQTDLNSITITLTSGYLMVMKLIYDYILREITSDPNAEINFSVIEMIFDSVLSNEFHKYLFLLGFFIIISYAIVLSINIYREINLRETKKKEYLKSIGVKEQAIFISSFIRFFFINIIHSFSTALIIKYILKQSQYIYLLIILFFYGLVIFSMIYFFQSFLQEGRKGVILSLLCYSIMSSFILPINSPRANKHIINLFCVFFPPVNLMLGIDVFCTYEKQFHKFEDISLDVGQITIKEMIIFFFCSFILYLIIGSIISSYFHYDQGISKFCRKKSADSNVQLIRKLNSDLESNIHNISYNKKRVNDDGSSTNSDKKINIIENSEDNISSNKDNLGDNYIDNSSSNKDNLGDNYIDNSDQSSLNEVKNNIKQNKQDLIKLMAHYAINTPEGKYNYSETLKKISLNIRKSFNEFANFLEPSNNQYLYIDELENDFMMNKKRQYIRNLRRQTDNTMCNLKGEEYFIKNLDINGIKSMLIDNISKENDNNSSEDANTISENLSLDGYNNAKDKINKGQRLEIKNLQKYYISKDKKVLDGLDFTMYENEIFALLGENGAGKSTFISILGGLIEASGGSIIYKENAKDEGYDITNHKGNSEFRKILGICAQNNNILFNDLTVKENLETFCLLKNYNGSRKEIEVEVNNLMKKFDLEEKSNFLAKKLSGGQKRKLCIAIACLGKSKIIILDEPTGGVDIASQKNIWKILKKIKLEQKILILISHSMEEVSFLADKIGILKNGKLICKGTSRELINKFGNYFSLIVNKKMGYEKANEISSFILKKYYDLIEDKESDKASESSGSTLISVNDKNIKIEVFKERVIFRISNKYFNRAKSSNLLKDLKEKYNIDNYLIIEDRLEDIFINTINKNIIASNKVHYMVLSSSYDIIKETRRCIKFKNELKLLFFKRLKDVSTNISEILVPIILILIACLVSYVEWLDDNKSQPINLIDLNDGNQKIYYDSLTEIETNDYTFIQNIFKEDREKLKKYEFIRMKNDEEEDNKKENITDLTLTEIIIYYLEEIKNNQKKGKMTNNYVNFLFTNFNSSTHKYEFVLFVDTKRKHYPIFFTNYILNIIIKLGIKRSNQYNYDIDFNKVYNQVSLSNMPYLMNYNERNDKKSRNGFTLVFFISIALALIPSNLVTSITREKENKSKHLQILSGLSIYTYWFNNYIFEILKYFIIALVALLIIFLLNFYEKYLVTLYVLYGLAMIPFTFCISYFINKEGTGQTITLLINLLFGTLGSSAIFILRTDNSTKTLGKILSYCFRVVPNFCISYAYNQLISKKILLKIDNLSEEIDNPDFMINYIKEDIIYLASEMVVYTVVLIILEDKDTISWKLCRKCRKKNYYINNISNSNEISNNKTEVDKKYEQGSFEPMKKEANDQSSNLLSVENINRTIKLRGKYFNFCKRETKKVLDDLSFNVGNGECFGLIGTNGAGKTTVFRCLCKEIKPKPGIIKIKNTDIYDLSSKDKPSIGYCPQFDSIFEYLTVLENITFFGKLKGYSDRSLKTLAETVLTCLDLKKFYKVKCKNLSGGNKRKLSVAISIISRPDIIFLDEPSTGMDPFSRRLLMNLLNYGYLNNNNKKKNLMNETKGIILITHSIEEIESLCDRVGILIDGKMNKDRINNIDKIIQKNSHYIILNLEFKKPKNEELIEKYKDISKERVKNGEDIKNFLNFANRKEYIKFIKEDSLGRDLLNLTNKKKEGINKYSILVWIKYIDYLQELVKLLKQDFEKVYCIQFQLNNFILKIQKKQNENKCDSCIFGILESYKDKLKIEEYAYILTTLEKIFLEFCKEAYQQQENFDLFENESNNGNKLNVELNF